MLETEMYQPIKDYLVNQGYSVKAEVLNIDVVAKKEDQIVIVEMKKSLSMKLLYQGCNRQKLYDDVYIAISHPGNRVLSSKSFHEKLHILRRLRLGLMIVDVPKNQVEVLLDPIEYTFKRNNKRKNLLLKEFNQRNSSMNIGGSSGRKIMTAYKEQSIKIGIVLLAGPQSCREIRKITNIVKTTSILYDNYYQWYVNIDRGIYGLTPKGVMAMREFEITNNIQIENF